MAQSETLKILLFNDHTGIVDENKRGLFKSSIKSNHCDYLQANSIFFDDLQILYVLEI